MSNIQVLDQGTINKIAAGEVIERPASVVKELLENSIDAGSTSITVEIKEGGNSLIRITDNGSGIAKNDISIAFLRHSTSKIRSVEDLVTVSSLGFRGEALSSIAAVGQVELITKTPNALTGNRYVIEGGIEKSFEEIGAPEGTTFIIRNLFFNTPARRKFLKAAATESGYVSNIVERIALSHPEISIRFINNNQNKIHTSGNTKLKDIIYNIYGKEIATNLVKVESSVSEMSVIGLIGKPIISRGNRNFENYYINGRYIRSSIIAKAIEDAYKGFMMQHKYPFTVLHFTINPDLLDVNVHPTKMELRFKNSEEVYPFVFDAIKNALTYKEFIPEVKLSTKNDLKMQKEQKATKVRMPEPFEKNRTKIENQINIPQIEQPINIVHKPIDSYKSISNNEAQVVKEETKQINLFDTNLLTPEARVKHKIVGQVFDTYWIVQYEEKMFIIDQHAAHEKVLYEETMCRLQNKQHTSQSINPPIVLSLSLSEEELLNKDIDQFKNIGFEIEHFGGREYAVRAVPDNMFSLNSKDLLIDMLDSMSNENFNNNTDSILDKIASISCKAAVKGNNKLSIEEVEELIDKLLVLENPYNCPHGRPVIISMSKYELEKKFKRIV